MKLKKLIYITLLFTSILLLSCKEKKAANDTSKPFAIEGLQFTVHTDNGNYEVPLYAEPTLNIDENGYTRLTHYYEPLEYLEDGKKYKILSYDYEHRTAKVQGKINEGWIPVMHPAVIFDKEILFWCINSALEGNDDACCSMYFNFSKITLEESMKKIRYIIDYKGAENFKTIQHYTDEGAAMIASIARLIELAPHPDFGENVTNPIHLLAEYANEDTLKFLDNPDAYSSFYSSTNHLSSFYKNAFFDSEGVSAQMHAVKAGNYEALKYFYENKIPDYYFATLAKTTPENTQKFYPLIMTTKDFNKKSLSDYVAECKDEKIKNLIAAYDMKNHITMSDCLEYLRNQKDWRDFQTLGLLCAPVPYTNYKALNFPGNNSFVYLTDEDFHRTYNENLNIRDKPDKSGTVIGKLPYGTKVTVLEQGNEKLTIDEISDFWYKVSANGMEGWCFGGYLANPVKYVTLEEIEDNDEQLYEIRKRQIQWFTSEPSEWLYQVDFEDTTQIVIKETKLLNPKGEDITIHPFEKIEILEKIKGKPGEDLWDYGIQDMYYWREYFTRYNYYLVRTQDYKMGIIGGSALIHSSMYKCYEGPDIPGGSCESPYDFYFRLLYHQQDKGDYTTKYYAELYEFNRESKEIHALATGYSEGPVFQQEPVYLGENYESVPMIIELLAYRDFDMGTYDFWNDSTKIEPFYSFIFKTYLDFGEVSYNTYTVALNSRCAWNSLYRDSHDTRGKSEDDYYKYSYCYFETENRKIPECIFGEFDMYSPEDCTHECLRHQIEHLSIDYISRTFHPISTEELDYAPDW